jgi:hypothetical protein
MSSRTLLRLVDLNYFVIATNGHNTHNKDPR